MKNLFITKTYNAWPTVVLPGKFSLLLGNISVFAGKYYISLSNGDADIFVIICCSYACIRICICISKLVTHFSRRIYTNTCTWNFCKYARPFFFALPRHSHIMHTYKCTCTCTCTCSRTYSANYHTTYINMYMYVVEHIYTYTCIRM